MFRRSCSGFVQILRRQTLHFFAKCDSAILGSRSLQVSNQSCFYFVQFWKAGANQVGHRFLGSHSHESCRPASWLEEDRSSLSGEPSSVPKMAHRLIICSIIITPAPRKDHLRSRSILFQHENQICQVTPTGTTYSTETHLSGRFTDTFNTVSRSLTKIPARPHDCCMHTKARHFPEACCLICQLHGNSHRSSPTARDTPQLSQAYFFNFRSASIRLRLGRWPTWNRQQKGH